MNGRLPHGLGQWVVLRDGLVVWFYTYRDHAERRAEPGDVIVYVIPAHGVRHHLPFARHPLDPDWYVGPDPETVLGTAARDDGRLFAPGAAA